MLTVIERSFSFKAGLYFDKQFFMNKYELTCFMEVDTESIREQNVAMERLKYFLNEALEHSIFIRDSEKETIEKYLNCDLKVSTLPEDPYDQIISLMLLTKLNSISEGKLIITDVNLRSDMSDEVTFMCSIESPLGPFETNGWWNDSIPSINGFNKHTNKKDKIVKLIKSKLFDWADIDLCWKEKPKGQLSQIKFTTDPEVTK
jgi:hypothetical protein